MLLILCNAKQDRFCFILFCNFISVLNCKHTRLTTVSQHRENKDSQIRCGEILDER